jgi:hypothetical protein
MRWRWKRRAGQSAIPYRGLMRWHHITGLLFGVTATTWVLSGMLSMNPGSINPSRSPAQHEALVFSGKALTVADFDAPVNAMAVATAVDTELLHYDSQPFYKVTQRDGQMYLVNARVNTSGIANRLPSAIAVVERAALLMPEATLERVDVMDAYDDYYYTRHPENGGKPLPVVRARFADDRHTWFHIDPLSGEVLDRSTRWNRAYRWLYNGLHSWDIRWLWERRPLWDIVVIGFSLGGLTLSIVGVIAGWRRLQWEMGVTRPARLPADSRRQAAAAK